MLNFSVKTKKIVFSSLALAIATVTSYITIIKMPMGGAVTLLSMLFICLIGYWFGPKYGVVTGITFGILQFILNPFILSIPQVLIDYPLAFGALGLSGFFKDNKYGLQIGYVVGVIGRFIFAVISGMVFFAYYTPDGMNPLIYCILYNGSYLGVEAIITLIVISIPAVSKALNKVKDMANNTL